MENRKYFATDNPEKEIIQNILYELIVWSDDSNPYLKRIAEDFNCKGDERFEQPVRFLKNLVNSVVTRANRQCKMAGIDLGNLDYDTAINGNNDEQSNLWLMD